MNGCCVPYLALALYLSTPDQTEIARHVQEARSSIRTGRVDFEFRVYKASAGVASEVNAGSYHCAFENDQLRCDLKHGQEVRRTLLTDGELYTHIAEPGRNFATALRIDHKLSVGELEKNRQAVMLDPRVVGMYVVSALQLHAMRASKLSIAPNPDTKFQIAEDDVEGVYCWRVDIEWQNSGTQETYWISPDMGYNVVRGTARYGLKDGRKFVDSIDCKLREYGKDKIWYPETVSFRREVNGEPVMRDEIITKDASFNEPLDVKAEFSIAGFDLPPDSGVYEQPANPTGAVRWDGEKLAPYHLGDRRKNLSAAVAHSNRWRQVIGLSAGALGAALFALYAWRRKNLKTGLL